MERPLGLSESGASMADSSDKRSRPLGSGGEPPVDSDQKDSALFSGHSASDFGPPLGEGLPPVQVQENGGE